MYVGLLRIIHFCPRLNFFCQPQISIVCSICFSVFRLTDTLGQLKVLDETDNQSEETLNEEEHSDT